MIKNIIFDMGNVLIRFDRELFFKRAGITGSDKDLLTREIFLSVDWARLDRGSYTEAQAIGEMCSRLPERLHPAVHQLVEHWDEPLIPIEGMAELLIELKQRGYGLFLLSNASRRQHEYWPRVPGHELFDGTVISADLLLVKPQPEIFLYTLSTFGLKAEECVFIDDSASNVEAAQYCNIPALVFHGDVPRLRRELNAMGIL